MNITKIENYFEQEQDQEIIVTGIKFEASDEPIIDPVPTTPYSNKWLNLNASNNDYFFNIYFSATKIDNQYVLFEQNNHYFTNRIDIHQYTFDDIEDVILHIAETLTENAPICALGEYLEFE